MKKIKLLLRTVMLIIVILLYGCDSFPDKRYLMNVDNHFSSTICWNNAFGGGEKTYPDTTLLFKRERVNRKVKAEGKYYDYYSLSFEELFSDLPQDTLSMYFFSQDTLDKYSWEEIQAGYKVLIRYDISLQDLIRLDYTISYPPDERMRSIKMYPSYEGKKNSIE